MNSTPYYVRALGIGAAAGMRSMTAPAATLRAGKHGLAGLATLAAAGELVADKLPFVPSRISPPLLGARLLSGGWCGSALAGRGRGSPVVGALVGALGAGTASWLFYSVRKHLTQRHGLPDAPVALAEDALAVWLARAAASPA